MHLFISFDALEAPSAALSRHRSNEAFSIGSSVPGWAVFVVRGCGWIVSIGDLDAGHRW